MTLDQTTALYRNPIVYELIESLTTEGREVITTFESSTYIPLLEVNIQQMDVRGYKGRRIRIDRNFIFVVIQSVRTADCMTTNTRKP